MNCTINRNSYINKKYSEFPGYSLYYVVLHEIGHVLGLDHTDVEKAVMFPTYLGRDTAFPFHMDDINGIQALYGRV